MKSITFTLTSMLALTGCNDDSKNTQSIDDLVTQTPVTVVDEQIKSSEQQQSNKDFVIRPHSFMQIAALAKKHHYLVVEQYNPEKQDSPRVVLVSSRHNQENLNRLRSLLPLLLQKGDIFSYEGRDDQFEKHLATAKRGEPSLNSQYIAQHYAHITQHHPYFTTLERIAIDAGCTLKGFDNAVLGFLQTDLKRIANSAHAVGNNKKADETTRIYNKMQWVRTAEQVDGVLSLTKQKGSTIYHVAGGLHLGIFPEVFRKMFQPKLQESEISYMILAEPETLKLRKK